MSQFALHPATGKHYVLSISAESGPYEDIWNMYVHAAKSREWLRVAPPNEVLDMRTMQFYVDPAVVFVIFEPTKFDPWPKSTRKATVVGVYSEALGGALLPAHTAHLERFRELVHRYDAITVHAPGAAEILQAYFGTSVDIRRLPIGWCPTTMGKPDFAALRPTKMTFLGSEVGRRTEIIKRLASEIVIDWPRTVYGPRALALLRASESYLYVAHSLCSTFSTWRIWQALATGTTLIAERATDSWPAVPGEHFIALDHIDPPTVREALESNLQPYAVRAYDELGPHFTIDRVIEDYLVPLGVARESL